MTCAINSKIFQKTYNTTFESKKTTFMMFYSAFLEFVSVWIMNYEVDKSLLGEL